MKDADMTQTLFGQPIVKGVPWPHGYGSTPTLLETTLFGQVADWKLHRWPEGYGGKP